MPAPIGVGVTPPPIGLIAGKGEFPLVFAQEAKKNKRELIVLALAEEANEDFNPYAKSVHSVSIGKLNQMIQTLKKEGVKEAVMAGRVEHRKLFSDILPDFRAIKLLQHLKDRRADSILSAVAEEFKKDGIQLLPSTTFLSHLMPKKGNLTRRKLRDSEMKNIEFGIQIAKGLAALDIGQTVVVKRRTVLAAEAMEGTDECIKRGAKIGGEGVIVVKSAKPNQDLRFDVPIVGLHTISVLREVNAKVLAVEADKTLILKMEQCIEEANGSGLSLYAW